MSHECTQHCIYFEKCDDCLHRDIDMYEMPCKLCCKIVDGLCYFEPTEPDGKEKEG
jgi:hypothetical protein